VAAAVGTYAATNWVPDAWQDVTTGVPGTSKLYTEVVAHYCRTCHVAQTNGGIGHDWATWSSFSLNAPTIQAHVCEVNDMPQAEITQDHLWNSPARAHLISALGLNTHCKPVTQ
jgi:hypothetical protein